MTKPISPSRGGIAGVLLVFCVAGGGAGLAFDFLSDSGQDFWILQAPGKGWSGSPIRKALLFSGILPMHHPRF